MTRRRRRRPLAVTLRRALAPALGLAMAVATPTPGRTEPPPARPAALAEVPLTVPALGVSLRLPTTARATEDEGERGPVLTAVERGDEPGWSLRLQEIEPTVPEPVLPGRQLDAVLEAHGASGRTIEVLARDRLADAGLPASRLWIRETDAGGRSRLLGWACASLGPDRLVLLSMQARTDRPDARPTLDAMLETLRVRPPASVADERVAALERGAALIAALDETRLRSLVGRRQVVRTVRPGPGGTERVVADTIVEVDEGPRGIVNPRRQPVDYETNERTPGLVVRVFSTMPVEGGATQTTLAIYWMAWDHSEETWSVRTSTRAGGRSREQAISGVRTPRSAGDPRGSITVVTSTPGEPPAFWKTPDVYLSQALRWIVGRLPAVDELGLLGPEATDASVSWYAIDVRRSGIALALREDRWIARPEAVGWTHEGRARQTDQPVRSVFDAAGDLLRADGSDGTVTRPATDEETRRGR